jgi:RNA polymerase sigma factor (sigma-70 family)
MLGMLYRAPRKVSRGDFKEGLERAVREKDLPPQVELEAFRAGDPHAFEVLHQRFRKPVLSWLADRVPDFSAAEDLAQEIFLKILRARREFDPARQLSSWVWAIVRNTWTDWMRASGRLAARSTQEFSEGFHEDAACDLPDPEMLLAGRSVRREVRRALARLSVLQRRVLLLRLTALGDCWRRRFWRKPRWHPPDSRSARFSGFVFSVSRGFFCRLLWVRKRGAMQVPHAFSKFPSAGGPLRWPRAALVSLACAALAGLASRARAELALGWADCVQEAKGANLEIRAARERLAAQGFDARAAYAGFLPSVTFSGGVTSSSVAQSALSGGAGGVLLPTDPTRTTLSLSLGVSQNLFNGLQDLGRVRQAAAQLEVSRAELLQALAQASFDLKSAYAGMLFAQRSERIQEQILARREENLRLVELRFESGRENKGSVLLAGAYLAQARFEALQAKNQLWVARAQLLRALGRTDAPGLSTLRVSERPGQAMPETPVAATTGSEPELQGLIESVPQRRRLAAQEDAARAALHGARSGFFPTLGVSASSFRTGTSWFPANDGWSVGASVAWSLFSGGRDYHATRGAYASARAAAQSLAGGELAILASLRQARAGYILAVEKLKADEAFEEAARVRAEIARARYNNGLLSFDAWDIIEGDLIGRQRAVLASRRERAVAEAEWERVRGVGVFGP